MKEALGWKSAVRKMINRLHNELTVGGRLVPLASKV